MKVAKEARLRPKAGKPFVITVCSWLAGGHQTAAPQLDSQETVEGYTHPTASVRNPLEPLQPQIRKPRMVRRARPKRPVEQALACGNR